jgi:hypothetical protein
MRGPAALVYVPVLTLVVACSSSPSVLYHEGDPPRLKDGAVTLRTQWFNKTAVDPDIRRVTSRSGVVTAELISRSRGHHVGEVPVADWEKIWRTMLELGPFGDSPRFDVQADDPRAPGPYHLVSLELDGRFHEFSAQYRHNIFGVFKTGDVDERLRYSNAVQELVDEYAREPVPAAPKTEPEEPRESPGR